MNVDRAAVERSWKEHAFACALWVDPPGQVWSDYVHDTDQLVMVVAADVECKIGGKAPRPSPDEESLFPLAPDIRRGTPVDASRAGATATGDDDARHTGPTS